MVATGSMKAKLHESAAGIMYVAGSSPAAMAMAARMGISRVAVAVLEVTSVRNVTLRQSTSTTRMGGRSVMAFSEVPMD